MARSTGLDGSGTPTREEIGILFFEDRSDSNEEGLVIQVAVAGDSSNVVLGIQ